jgi:radical SAM-linked protein
MEFETRPATTAFSAARPQAPADKVRFRFKKGGALRLLSHHDLLRTFERMLRRAELPVRATQGFHPKPRLVFALSLPLGVVGREEVGELELDEVLAPEGVHARLARQAPPGLEILSVRRVPPRTQAQVRLLCYRLAVPDDRVPDLAERIRRLLAAPEYWVERTRPALRRVNLRQHVTEIRLVDNSPTHSFALEMDLSLTPAGTARPDEVLAALGLSDLLEAGAVLERVRLELHDESVEKGSGPFLAGP